LLGLGYWQEFRWNQRKENVLTTQNTRIGLGFYHICNCSRDGEIKVLSDIDKNSDYKISFVKIHYFLCNLSDRSDEFQLLCDSTADLSTLPNPANDRYVSV